MKKNISQSIPEQIIYERGDTTVETIATAKRHREHTCIICNKIGTPKEIAELSEQTYIDKNNGTIYAWWKCPQCDQAQRDSTPNADISG